MNADRGNVSVSQDRNQLPGQHRNSSMQGQERSMHDAHDLLHLKYSDDAHFREHDQIKREDVSAHQLRIPFESSMMRQDQGFARLTQRDDFLPAKQEPIESSIRLSVHSPPMRDVVAAVRDSAVPVRDVMAAVRDTMTPMQHPVHTLAQTIHHIQNSYAFPGLHGPPI